jgi:ABC-type antimicrobial peptide transport system permease subunit
MENFIGSVLTFGVFAFLIVFLSGEFHPKSQTIKTWLLVAAAIPLGYLLIAFIVGIFTGGIFGQPAA